MTSISIEEYYAVAGTRFTKADAEVIGPSLAEISKRGEPTPREIVELARSQNSPLNKYFEWNDKVAADRYRLIQADEMIKSIRVKYSDAGQTKTRQVVKIGHADDSKRSPVESTIVLGDKAVAVHLMRNALLELTQWKERYERHQSEWDDITTAFIGVFNQIDEMTSEVRAEEFPEMTSVAVRSLQEWRRTHTDAFNAWNTVSSQLRYVHEAIMETERLFAGVEAKHVKRCMTCKGEFVSSGAGNRLCDKCRAKSNGYDEHLNH